MENVTIRDYIDQRFADLHRHVDSRFDTLDGKVDDLSSHTHSDKVGWPSFLTTVLALVGLILAMS